MPADAPPDPTATGRLAIVGGHTLLGVALDGFLGREPRVRDVKRRGRTITVLDTGSVVFLQRHAQAGAVLAPHLDHHAHAAALAALGCDRVVGIASVGGLRAELVPGTTLVPDDFISLAAQPDSRFTDPRAYRVPAFTPAWRTQVVAAWRTHAAEAPFDGGVYWQTTGPRFETAAEVRYLSQFADVVGMTVGSECVAFTERDLDYAAVCVVDNLANGVGAAPLTMAEFEAGRAANAAATVAALRGVVGELAT